MPDRTDAEETGFLNTEGGLGFAERKVRAEGAGSDLQNCLEPIVVVLFVNHRRAPAESANVKHKKGDWGRGRSPRYYSFFLASTAVALICSCRSGVGNKFSFCSGEFCPALIHQAQRLWKIQRETLSSVPVKKDFRLFLEFLVLQIVFAESSAAEKIRVAVANQNVSFVSAGVALKRNFWKEEGLEPEVITMRPPVSIAALASREIDYTMVFGSVVGGAIRGLPLRVVASLIDISTHALIARPEYKSAKELRKRIAEA